MSDDKKRLLKVKKEIKARTPKFKRENYFRLKRIQTGWRSAKGIDSKMRHKLKGKRKSPNIGYRGPKAVRGLHPLGKEIVRVQNLNQLKEVGVDSARKHGHCRVAPGAPMLAEKALHARRHAIHDGGVSQTVHLPLNK